MSSGLDSLYIIEISWLEAFLFIFYFLYACEELPFCESGVVKIVHIRLIKSIDY